MNSFFNDSKIKKIIYSELNLFEAIKYNSSKQVRNLIELGKANVSEKYHDGLTPLHHTMTQYYGHLDNGKSAIQRLEIVKLLVSAGSDISEKNNSGFTPLHFASRGYIDIVKFLVSIGSNVLEKNDSGETPLHLASAREDLEIVKFLISVGSNVSEKNNSGETPLHYASRRGNLEVVKFLVSLGSNVLEKNDKDQTPLHYASKRGHLEIVRFLAQHCVDFGADINVVDLDGKTAIDVASFAKEEIKKILEESLEMQQNCGYVLK